ncbi:MAG: imidazole glycerol phosphate synthase subunit HisH [Kiritimatiellae bacterium]|nr:imidazole glycerol phosphate synthase subunit HisH [Kiritimatiellia bacterium]MDW8458399.1 imidazole glycerol phosphate synthase subunit HisH [Verrucomicrobiota bacterium]
MIGILDYEAGNLGSVTNAFRFLEIPARVVAEPSALRGISAMVLPGVGAFGDCLAKLRARGFEGPVRSWIMEGRPFLGICVGLQALYEGSEESPGVPGLGIFRGVVRRFPERPDLKVPQIGWNSVRQVKPDCPLFAGIPDESYFYFVHSYRAEAGGDEVAGVADYGGPFAAAVWRDNVLAIQFHPEKSQKVGLALLQNFADWAYERTAPR